MLNPESWTRDLRLFDAANQLRNAMGDHAFEDFNVFQHQANETIDKAGIRLTAADRKIILRTMSWREESAPPVIKKIVKRGDPDPFYGLFEIQVNGRSQLIEYEPETELRDSEQVPLLEPGGIEAFIRREVLSHFSDAWIDKTATKIGYEISFTRHFYKPTPKRLSGDSILQSAIKLLHWLGWVISQIIGKPGEMAVCSHSATKPDLPNFPYSKSRFGGASDFVN